MPDYPQTLVPENHIEPVPRRIRATLGGKVVLDTTGAIYVWEWSPYPQYYIPLVELLSRFCPNWNDTNTVHAHVRR